MAYDAHAAADDLEKSHPANQDRIARERGWTLTVETLEPRFEGEIESYRYFARRGDECRPFSICHYVQPSHAVEMFRLWVRCDFPAPTSRAHPTEHDLAGLRAEAMRLAAIEISSAVARAKAGEADGHAFYSRRAYAILTGKDAA